MLHQNLDRHIWLGFDTLGMEMQASSEKFLDEVISAHRKKAAIIGQSQCEKKLAGNILGW